MKVEWVDFRLEETDYSKFVFHKRIMRKLVLDRLWGLKRSMEVWGFTEPIKVMGGNKKLLVLAGRHRFTAAKELGIPIVYDLIKIEPKEAILLYIAHHDVNQRAWATGDLYKMYVESKVRQFLEIDKWLKDNRVFDQSNPSSVISALFPRLMGPTFQKSYLFKIADYTIEQSDWDYANGIMRQIGELTRTAIVQPEVRKSIRYRKAVVRVATRSTYDHARMLRVMRGRVVSEARGQMEYIKQFADPFNKKLSYNKQITLSRW